MKTPTFYEPVIKVSERLMSTYCLEIGKEKFEIISLSIHYRDRINPDTTVTKNRSKAMHWFVSPNEYSRYIDIDISTSSKEGGLRIDSIRSMDGKHTEIISCGNVHDYINKKITLSNINGKNVIDESVYLRLTQHDFKTKTFYYFPRISGYDFKVPMGFIPNLSQRFLLLKISKSQQIESLLDLKMPYKLQKKHIPLILNVCEKEGVNSIATKLNIKESRLNDYLAIYLKGKLAENDWALMCQEVGQNSSFKLIAALSGYFSKK